MQVNTSHHRGKTFSPRLAYQKIFVPLHPQTTPCPMPRPQNTPSKASASPVVFPLQLLKMKKIYWISLVVAVSGVLLYSCNNPSMKHVIDDVSSPCDTTFCFSGVTSPHFASIDIRGAVSGECFFSGDLIGDSIRFKDSINYYYETEWYIPYIEFRYSPTGIVMGDSIVVKYEMW